MSCRAIQSWHAHLSNSSATSAGRFNSTCRGQLASWASSRARPDDLLRVGDVAQGGFLVILILIPVLGLPVVGSIDLDPESLQLLDHGRRNIVMVNVELFQLGEGRGGEQCLGSLVAER